jgi:hypothetical protein
VSAAEVEVSAAEVALSDPVAACVHKKSSAQGTTRSCCLATYRQLDTWRCESVAVICCAARQLCFFRGEAAHTWKVRPASCAGPSSGVEGASS